MDADIPNFENSKTKLISMKINCTMGDIFNSFKNEVDSFSEFWDVMDAFDKHFNTLVTKDSTSRQIMYQGCSIRIYFDPAAPTAIPKCLFFGGDVAEELKERWKTNLNKWSLQKPPLDNLETCLSISLKTPNLIPQSLSKIETEENHNKSTTISICSICYGGFDEEDEGMLICPNMRCAVEYHILCWREWTKAITSNPRTLQFHPNSNIQKGTCSSCGQLMTVPNTR